MEKLDIIMDGWKIRFKDGWMEKLDRQTDRKTDK